MNRPWIKVLLCALLALPMLAQDAAPPRFHIESIDVRNTRRVSRDVIIAESLLREGNEYTEAELSDASARLNRLPFLLSAEFSLEKGTERGRHVLVVTVEETKPFFYRLDLRPVIEDEDYRGFTEPADSISASENEAFVGYRWFVGRRGVVHAGLQYQNDQRDYTTDYGAWAVGYTHYDLFGSRAFATLNLKWTDGGGRITPQVVVGMPLTTNQTLTAAYDDVRIEGDVRTFSGVTFDDSEAQRVASLTWSYNTTNQPYLPTRGTRVSVTPLVAWRDDAFLTYDWSEVGEPPEVGKVVVHRRSAGLDVSASRFWELTGRSSVSLRADAGWAKTRDTGEPVADTFDSRYALAQGGYAWSFWDRALQRDGDHRLEFTAQVATRTREGLQRRGLFTRDEATDATVTAAWVRRSSWGIVRLGLGWAW